MASASSAGNGGGINGDCTDLYKETKKLLSVLQRTAAKAEVQLLELSQAKARQESLPAPTNVGRLRAQHDLGPLLEDARSGLARAGELEKRFVELARDESSCRRTLFFRARHLLAQLERVRLSLVFLLRRYVELLLAVVANRATLSASTTGGDASDWVYALECADAFNVLLTNCGLTDDDGRESGCGPATVTAPATLIHVRRHRGAHLHENFRPTSSYLAVRPITSSRLLQLLASRRAWLAAAEISRSIVLGIDRRQLEMTTEEVAWLNLPETLSGAKDFQVLGDAPVLLKSSAKNKDGNGVKRKNRNHTLAKPEDSESPTSDYHSQNGGGALANSEANHTAMVEDFVASEDAFIGNLLTLFAQVPGLLGKSVLKEESKKGKAALSRAGRVRMSEYYHDHLWQAVGPLLERTILWGDLPGLAHLPYGLQHPRACLGLSNILQDHLYSKFGEGYPPVVFPAVQLLLESLNLHVVAASWDLQFLHCLSEASRSYTAPAVVKNMRSGSAASRVGMLYYDALKATVRLNNRCHPDMIRDFVEHGSHDPEEYPFVEELQALRRLLAALHAMRGWARSRASAALNAWQVRDFLLITQGDLVNVEDCFTILQLENHERNSLTRSVNIQMYTHVQAEVCKEIRDCQKFIRDLLQSSLVDMSRVCRTFSLATLQNVFPSDRHWRLPTSTPTPTSPSPYVHEFIGRVLAPVFEALAEMKTEIQQSVARVAIKSFCEAWLEHIRSCRIKFSDHGAQQIAQDFGALRTWISTNQHVRDDTRRYLLLLDSLRQCEGVAKLLRSKQGEMLDIKPSKNKVSPITDDASVGHRPDSPVQQILEAIPAELYVPNQQEWISLKTNSKIPLPFCCR